MTVLSDSCQADKYLENKAFFIHFRCSKNEEWRNIAKQTVNNAQFTASYKSLNTAAWLAEAFSERGF